MAKPQDQLNDMIPPSPIKVTDSPMTQRRKRHKANLLKRLRVIEEPYPAADVITRDTTVTRVVAKWKFDARNERELSFVPGDVIVIVVQDDAEKGWWMGSLHGKEGLLPVNYVDVYEVMVKKRLKVDQKNVSGKIRMLQKQISSGKVLDELLKMEGEKKDGPSTPLKAVPAASLVEMSPAGRRRRRNISVKLSSAMGYGSPKRKSMSSPPSDSPAGKRQRTEDGSRDIKASTDAAQSSTDDSTNKDEAVKGLSTARSDARAARKLRMKIMREEAAREAAANKERGSAEDSEEESDDEEDSSGGDSSSSSSASFTASSSEESDSSSDSDESDAESEEQSNDDYEQSGSSGDDDE